MLCLAVECAGSRLSQQQAREPSSQVTANHFHNTRSVRPLLDTVARPVAALRILLHWRTRYVVNDGYSRCVRAAVDSRCVYCRRRRDDGFSNRRTVARRGAAATTGNGRGVVVLRYTVRCVRRVLLAVLPQQPAEPVLLRAGQSTIPTNVRSHPTS